MMKQISKYILSVLLILVGLAATSSCNDDINRIDTNDSTVRFSQNGNILLNPKMEIPGMKATATRALDETPDYANLNLYLFVFEEGKGLRQFEKIETTPNNEDEKHGHNALVKANEDLELQPTENRATVHLVATNQPDFESTVTFGTEERVITALSTRDGYEAYWQKIELGSNIPSAQTADPSSPGYIPGDKEKADNIKTLFNHVPMIRNFCRISVNTSKVTANFQLTGIYVMNTVDCGTVAPFVAGNEPGSRFVKYYKGGNGGPYEGMSYAEISEQNHVGSLPVNVRLINTDPNPANITTKSELADGVVKPVYFYERPARQNDERTFVILRGKFGGSDKDSYYKVDIGNVLPSDLGKEIGLFDFYNLLRNFDYVINLQRVEDAGYDTFEEAVKGSVFNNFSAALETRNMASISDGDDILTVNRISFVFTSSDQIHDLLAMYQEDISEGNGQLRNDLIKIKWEAGPVISDIVEETTPFVDNSGTWRHWKVYGNDPDDKQYEQTVYVYRGNKGTDENPEYGLYRIITFILTKPWNLPHIEVFNNNTIETPDWGSTANKNVGTGIGANVALFFELPGNLPEAIFPLKFTIESDLQNIQNAYVGNAVVNSVAGANSLFNDDQNPPQTSRIQYIKTISWEDYDALKDPEEQGVAGSAIVRVRFLTITDLNSTVINQTETRLRVKCENFGRYDSSGKYIDYFETTFQRPKNP